ncbi:MAG: hypothetical protein A3A33_03525 [Candidatus Yanofskybacteria bacterium RIFCSPLOWO2_01_FULL_49_25]|uniref:Uncharacterized protein n=1 Tax=Candidatus Yanofskybacteria bacterium RIFCSPLOWO2_01_FULL_49_25 TaxID=1802701 RepID=A0A1F8GU53_9BACT|nr:MAG: hypothetical protein A3A33_03525 [Candidatus Yanofskybacteria bacterium RIFCSPLOWO2_01_FULL_49_25]
MPKIHSERDDFRHPVLLTSFLVIEEGVVAVWENRRIIAEFVLTLAACAFFIDYSVGWQNYLLALVWVLGGMTLGVAVLLIGAWLGEDEEEPSTLKKTLLVPVGCVAFVGFCLLAAFRGLEGRPLFDKD